MEGQLFVQDTQQRLANLEHAMQATQALAGTLNRIEGSLITQDGRDIQTTMAAMEGWLQSLQYHVDNLNNRQDKSAEIVDEKIKTAMSMCNANRPTPETSRKPILESKAIQDVGKLTDANTYRSWNRKMKNALEQTRPNSREVLEIVEAIKE